MNNKEFITELSRRTGYTQAQTQTLVRTLIAEMGNQFEQGNNLNVPNFGTFDIKKRLERIVVNPSTGQRMLVPPKLVLQFKPISTIKQQLKSGGAGNGED